MSTSTAPPASASNLPSDSRSRPFRRLSQLRSYTQNHLSSSSSSSSANPHGPQRSSYRNSISNRVPWRSSGSHQAAASSSAAADSESATAHSSTNASSCPEPERQSTLARYSSAFFSSYRGFESDLHSQGSSSSRSTPTDEPGASQTRMQTQTSGTMARLRGLTQTTDSRGNANNNNNNDSNSNANTGANDNDTRADASSPSGSGNPQSGSVESSDAAGNPSASTEPKQKPTMRFFPYQDPLHSARPSLHFIPISRTLPSDSCVIRVGRYSERDGIPIANPSEPSDAPIGFKSKVVSRKHCELIFLNGQWNIKDVGSSSGTFLNHMRLSQPNMASKLYTVKDGDIVQLGIDFRGGEEMIFRCVRIRIECNRSWQRQPNEFNKNTESLIRNLGKGNTADYSGCRECSICLGSVLVGVSPTTVLGGIQLTSSKRPYQCLFMAACAHVWHYKCVSRLIHTPDYPIFQCPNCRAYTDLSAEVDDSNDIVEEEPKENASNNAEQPQPRSGTQSPALENNATPIPPEESSTPEPEPESGSELPAEAGLAVNIENMHLNDEHRAHTENSPNADAPTPAPTSNPTSNPTNVHHSPNIDIPGSQTASPSPGAPLTRPAQVRSDTATRSEMSEDNPLTPRNDSGPLAFDGWTGIP